MKERRYIFVSLHILDNTWDNTFNSLRCMPVTVIFTKVASFLETPHIYVNYLFQC